MRSHAIARTRAPRLAAALAALALVGAACAPAVVETTPVQPTPEGPDPRIGLAAGYMDAEEAAWGMELVANSPRPDGFHNPANPGDFGFANSDLAFHGDLAIMGNFHGIKIYDISDPANPRLRTAIVCPGGQGDVSVYGDLVFMSVEQPRGRVDCGTQGVLDPGPSPERFRGVRIFDISNLDAPRQVAAVQTCRGSHTNTLVTRPGDDQNVYVYVSGAAGPRPAEELEGCLLPDPETDPDPPLFQIEVIQVPLAAPAQARIVSEPRIFADRETGEIAGLWPGGDHGPGTQRTAQTNHCHDITSYPYFGIAAGACSGNGIILDISEPASPVRTEEVVDPNFAYWHSAMFNNDATTVVFTDEWGGGTRPRCRAEDPENWGANAIFRLENGQLRHASYYKLPVPQTDTENCVAHNGSLVPVPGRDIKVQAWYQGGISIFDFTDPENPFEIAYFDRGPISETELVLGGHWSAYWYNGYIYGSEIARGLDVFRLVPNEHLSQAEIDAANTVRFAEFNPQHQPRMTWPASVALARALLDQLERSGAVSGERFAELAALLERADASEGEADRQAAFAALDAEAGRLAAEAEAAQPTEARRFQMLAASLTELAGTRTLASGD
jgi:hypothetical protein